MKTDKELLELAAKAAGLVGHDGFYAVPDDSSGEWRDWNPLNDDGDALRLAVKLNIDIRPNGFDTMCVTKCFQSCAETHGNDPYSATRRAIVRAAAAIGSKK